MSKSQTTEHLLGHNQTLRQRAEALDERLMTSTALVNGYVDRVNAARDKVLGAEADLNVLQHEYGHLPRVDDRENPLKGKDKISGALPLSVVAEREGALASAREELNRATVNKNRAATERNVASHYATGKDEYIAYAAANGGLSEISVKIPRDMTGESARAAWMALRKDRKAVENSITPITAEDIEAMVAAKASSARLVVSPRGHALIEPPIVRVAAEPLRSGFIPNAPDALALLCRYMPDAVVADLTEQAEKLSSGREVLTPPQKAKKLAEIDAEILRLQRIESELVWQARAAGQDTWFSKGLDIRAVLGVEGIAPK